MKKLMIAAAIVCAAAMSQAATCYWNIQNYTGKSIYNAGGQSLYTGTAYLFWVEGVAPDPVSGAARTVTQQYVIDHAADIATLGGKKLDVSSGVITATQDNPTSWSDTLSETGDVSRKYFIALVADDAVFVGTSTSGAETTDPSGRNLTPNLETPSKKDVYDAGSKFADKKAGWYSTADVPEPTSAMLILLGMAGLALRRRRA